jgi:hypothetical protein
MATLGELRSRILRLLGDPNGAGYSDEILLDSISSALDAILPWTPKTASETLTGDGTTRVFELPADLYEVEAIIVETTGEVLPGAILVPHGNFGVGITSTNDWLATPSGSITFSYAPGSGVIYNLYYLAYWTKPTTFNDLTLILEPPAQSLIGLTLYSTAYCLLPEAVGASEIRQFGTRIDSGTPEHNPMQKTALYMLDLFQREMNRHPKHQKAAK